MNKNIEIINDKLWLVNFDYLASGKVEEIPMTDDERKIVASQTVLIMKNGVIVFNNNIRRNQVYESYVPYMQAIMELKDDELYTPSGFFKAIKSIAPPTLSADQIEKLVMHDNTTMGNWTIFKRFCWWEVTRRKAGDGK